ncbi:hypothetical protein HMN09_01160600 [Mycena chlorophos]|uniref:MYND-type domain-containing protein n=1 Tax=Mycena chlorophos TaxID=658473 RepID=A0A8H6VWB3_MYCCL|nr:hypothetical protein HMN09_01160600 [Mycena chlorophos]
MPATQFAGATNLCYNCQKDNQPNLRRCARCQIARYCSPECQKQHWKTTHKALCFDRKERFSSSPSGSPDATLDQQMKDFAKWMEKWQEPVLDWALFAANLANQTPDFLRDHCFYAVLERRQDVRAHAPSQSRFRVNAAGMRPDSEVLDELRLVELIDTGTGYGREVIDAFNNVPRSPSILRFCISLPACNVFANAANPISLVVSRLDAEADRLTDRLRGESRLLGVALAAAWQQQFGEHVSAGNTTGHLSLFKSVKESLLEHAEKMAAVD